MELCEENWQIMCNVFRDYACRFCANYIHWIFRKSFKVTRSRLKWHTWIGYVYKFHCNYGCISHHFRDRTIGWKSLFFSYPLHSTSRLRGLPWKYCHIVSSVLRISGIASHFAPQIQANAMQQHFRISVIAMQNNAWIIALSSANLPLTFGSNRTLDYCG